MIQDEIVKQHYSVWRAFNHKIYRQTLTAEHLSNGEKYVESVYHVVKMPSGKYEVMEGKLVQTKCVFLEKGGKKYIMPAAYVKSMPLNPKETFECYLKESDKTIYRFVTVPISVKLSPEKFMSLKDLVTVFNPVKHSDERTWQFLKLQAIASKYKGGKYRLCSPPSCGKNSSDTILHLLFNNNVRVAKPTLAKLETLFYYHQKVLPDEMTSLTAANVREVEPFFLTLADESPTFTKHSMANKHDMNEVDVSQSSCVFTYNDPGSINPGSKFFDDIWQNIAAFNSRYPALFLGGEVVSEMPKLSAAQAKKIMDECFDGLRKVAKTIAYYVEFLGDGLHGWDRGGLRMSGRHKANFECVVDALDVVSDSQEEFDEWVDWVNGRVEAYRVLVGGRVPVVEEAVK